MPELKAGVIRPRFPSLIADEHHPDAATPGHTSVHNGDCHTDSYLLDGNVHYFTDLRAGDPAIDPNNKTGAHSGDHRRSNPSGHLGIQPIPVETLDR